MTVTFNGEWPTVPITPLFANADWQSVKNDGTFTAFRLPATPIPPACFLMKSFLTQAFSTRPPLSIMMNGACTTDLWERILNDKERRS